MQEMLRKQQVYTNSAHRKNLASQNKTFYIVSIFVFLYLNTVVKRFFESHQRSIECPQNPLETGIVNEKEDNRNSMDQEKNHRFLLYRLIGNDIPPLQCHGQLYKNTKYTLDYEPEFPDCRKLWVLNNIVNKTELSLLIDLLISRGYTTEDIIIRRINYTRIAALPKSVRGIAVTAQNEARNEIIRNGIMRGGRWILAFDGNQFYTNEAWNSIVEAANRHEKDGLKYFKVPMYRLYSKQQPAWLHGNSTFKILKKYAPVLWESQIAFRNDSEDRYIEGLKYGKDNKLELMDRVCGNGRYEKKKSHEGKEEVPADTGKCGCHKEVGCDRKQRSIQDKVPLTCGYSIRLWYHPCKGVDTSKIFVDKTYRAKLREEGHFGLENQIEREIESMSVGL